MKILRQQEREELELQSVQRQKIKPTLDRTQVKLLPVRYRSSVSHTQIEVTCMICVLTFEPPGTTQAARRIQRFVSKMLAKQPARMHHEIGVRQHQNSKGGTKQKVSRLLIVFGAFVEFINRWLSITDDLCDLAFTQAPRTKPKFIVRVRSTRKKETKPKPSAPVNLAQQRRRQVIMSPIKPKQRPKIKIGTKQKVKLCLISPRQLTPMLSTHTRTHACMQTRTLLFALLLSLPHTRKIK